jgi:hypothetical protein
MVTISRTSRPDPAAWVYDSPLGKAGKDLKFVDRSPPGTSRDAVPALRRRAAPAVVGYGRLLSAVSDVLNCEVDRGMPPKKKTTPQVFTLGYEQRNIKEFVDLLTEFSVDVLIDVRETAWSHKPGFSKSALAKAVSRAGIEYTHINWIGNPKWIRSIADSHEECLGLYRKYLKGQRGLITGFLEFIADIVDQGRSVCLVCYERHPDDCHRGILAELLEKHGTADVEHIAPEGRPRMVATA